MGGWRACLCSDVCEESDSDSHPPLEVTRKPPGRPSPSPGHLHAPPRRVDRPRGSCVFRLHFLGLDPHPQAERTGLRVAGGPLQLQTPFAAEMVPWAVAQLLTKPGFISKRSEG